MPAVKQIQLQRPDGSFGPWLDVDPGLDALRDRIRGRDPFRVRYEDQDVERERRLPGTMDRIEALVRKNDGGRIRVRTKDDKVFVIRIGIWRTEKVPPAPSNASPAIAQCHTFVFTRCEELEVDWRRELRVVTMGYGVNKWINGNVGGTPSQHCFGPPKPDGANAFDWVIRAADGHNDIAATDAIVLELVDKPYCSEVLWRGVASHYPGHAHASGDPKRDGIPESLR